MATQVEGFVLYSLPFGGWIDNISKRPCSDGKFNYDGARFGAKFCELRFDSRAAANKVRLTLKDWRSIEVQALPSFETNRRASVRDAASSTWTRK
jgi:hypothetical protein